MKPAGVRSHHVHICNRVTTPVHILVHGSRCWQPAVAREVERACEMLRIALPYRIEFLKRPEATGEPPLSFFLLFVSHALPSSSLLAFFFCYMPPHRVAPFHTFGTPLGPIYL